MPTNNLTPREIKALEAALKSYKKALEEITEQQEQLNELQKEESGFIGTTLKAMQATMGSTSDRLSLTADLIEKNKEANDLELQKIDILKDQLHTKKELGKITEDTYNEEVEKLKQKEKYLKEHNKLTQEQIKALEVQKNIANQSARAFGSIASKIGISQSGIANGAKQMGVLTFQAMKAQGPVKGMATSAMSIAGSFFDVINPVTILTSLISGIVKASFMMVLRTSEMRADFSAMAGDAGRMAAEIGRARGGLAGLSPEEAGAAAASLLGNFSRLIDISSSARGELFKMQGELSRLGVSGADTGQSLEFMMRGLGMSLRSSQSALKGLVTSAASLGQTPAMIMSNFRQLAGTLALYGGRVVKKFTEIAAVAKATGLEMQDIVSIGEGFDTFEGAATRVGQLNALVGGPMLDSMEMLRLQSEEGPEAVTKAVVESLKAQGKSYQNMGYQERKMIAESLNISTDKFAKLMGYQSEEAKAAEKKAKKEQADQKAYNKMLRDTVSIGRHWMRTLERIFTNPKLMRAMKKVISVILGAFGLNGDIGEGIQGLGDSLGELALKMADSFEAATKPGGWIHSLIKLVTLIVENPGTSLATWLGMSAAGSVASTALTAKLLGAGAGAAGAGAAGAGAAGAGAAGAAAAGAGAAAAGGILLPLLGITAGVATLAGIAYMVSKMMESKAETAQRKELMTTRMQNDPRFGFKKGQSIEDRAAELAEERKRWAEAIKPVSVKSPAAKLAGERKRLAEAIKPVSVKPETTSAIKSLNEATKKNQQEIAAAQKKAAEESGEIMGKKAAAAFVEEVRKNDQPVELRINFDDVFASPKGKRLLIKRVSGGLVESALG